MLTAAELAEALHVSEDFVYERAARGELPSYKIGGHRRFRESQVEAYLETMREGPVVEPHADRRPPEPSDD